MEEFIQVSLETLDDDNLLRIMKALNPKDVLELCSTSKAFAVFCRENTLWIQLMKHFYPYEDIGKNPKQQFTQLASLSSWIYTVELAYPAQEVDNEAYVPYIIDRKVIPKDNSVRFDSNFDVNDYFNWITEGYVEITGKKVTSGTRLWCYYITAHNGNLLLFAPEIKAYGSRNAAIIGLLEDHFTTSIEPSVEYGAIGLGGINQENIAQVLQDHTNLNNDELSPESLEDHFIDNDYFAIIESEVTDTLLCAIVQLEFM